MMNVRKFRRSRTAEQQRVCWSVKIEHLVQREIARTGVRSFVDAESEAMAATLERKDL